MQIEIYNQHINIIEQYQHMKLKIEIKNNDSFANLRTFCRFLYIHTITLKCMIKRSLISKLNVTSSENQILKCRP